MSEQWEAAKQQAGWTLGYRQLEISLVTYKYYVVLTKSRFEICEVSTVYKIMKTEYIINDNTKSFTLDTLHWYAKVVL